VLSGFVVVSGAGFVVVSGAGVLVVSVVSETTRVYVTIACEAAGAACSAFAVQTIAAATPIPMARRVRVFFINAPVQERFRQSPELVLAFHSCPLAKQWMCRRSVFVNCCEQTTYEALEHPFQYKNRGSGNFSLVKFLG
jgi:hypothetical protein